MRLGVGLTPAGVAVRAAPVPAPVTAEYTFAQIGPGVTMQRRNTDATYVYGAAFSTLDNTGTLWCGIITGTDAEMIATSSFFGDTPPNNMIEVAVDDGAWTTPARTAGDASYQLFSGLPHASRRVAVRLKEGYGTSGRWKRTGTVLRVTGAPPSVQVASAWLQPGDASTLTTTALKAQTQTDYTPARLPIFNIEGPYRNTATLAFRGTVSELWLASMSRWVSLSIDGGPPQRFQLQAGAGFVRVSGLTGEHTYQVWSDRGYMLAVGYTGTIAATAGLKGRLDQWGDSITEGVSASSGGHTDTFLAASRLGYLGGNHGLGGETTAQLAARLDTGLSGITVTSADAVVVAIGTNDGSTAAADRQASYASIISKLLAKGYGRVLMRGIIHEGEPGAPSNAPMQAAVTAANDTRVRYIDMTGVKTGLLTSDGLHPTNGGYDQIADAVTPKYQAILP